MKLEYVATKAIFIKPEPFDNGSGYRDIIESTINIRLTIYTLKVTENKRQLVYLDDQFINTNPHVIKNNVIVSPTLPPLRSIYHR
jgi:hypothetical protein